MIEPRLDQATALGKEAAVKPERLVACERMLDREDVDAVVIATTPHWHGLPHIHAAQAVKGIYVEKPLSHTVVEGRAMVQATKRHGLCFHGTEATMHVDRDGYEIWNEDQFESWNTNPQAPVERMDNQPFLPPGIGNESDGQWQRLFVECIRDGKQTPLDLEISHAATVCCHLANVACLTGRKITWDGPAEAIRDDPEAAHLLSRPRRAGYELPVRAG